MIFDNMAFFERKKNTLKRDTSDKKLGYSVLKWPNKVCNALTVKTNAII